MYVFPHNVYISLDFSSFLVCDVDSVSHITVTKTGGGCISWFWLTPGYIMIGGVEYFIIKKSQTR